MRRMLVLVLLAACSTAPAEQPETLVGTWDHISTRLTLEKGGRFIWVDKQVGDSGDTTRYEGWRVVTDTVSKKTQLCVYNKTGVGDARCWAMVLKGDTLLNVRYWLGQETPMRRLATK